jgi:hypothetical protein
MYNNISRSDMRKRHRNVTDGHKEIIFHLQCSASISLEPNHIDHDHNYVDSRECSMGHMARDMDLVH